MSEYNVYCKCGKGFMHKADYRAHRTQCEYLAPYEREPIEAPVLPIQPLPTVAVSDDLPPGTFTVDVEQVMADEIAALRKRLEVADELLLCAYNQLDPIYLADGVTLHPGCVSTLHDLYAYLWPEGKTI